MTPGGAFETWRRSREVINLRYAQWVTARGTDGERIAMMRYLAAHRVARHAQNEYDAANMLALARFARWLEQLDKAQVKP